MQFFIVTTSANIGITPLLARMICKHTEAPSLHFIVPEADLASFEALALERAIVHAETDFAPHIRLEGIQRWDVEGFPKRANWYYQQFREVYT